MSDSIFECVAVPSGNKEPPDQHFVPPNKGRPTRRQPGSRAKINVLCDRLERGEPLFDPQDLTCFDNGGPC